MEIQLSLDIGNRAVPSSLQTTHTPNSVVVVMPEGEAKWRTHTKPSRVNRKALSTNSRLGGWRMSSERRLGWAAWWEWKLPPLPSFPRPPFWCRDLSHVSRVHGWLLTARLAATRRRHLGSLSLSFLLLLLLPFKLGSFSPPCSALPPVFLLLLPRQSHVASWLFPAAFGLSSSSNQGEPGWKIRALLFKVSSSLRLSLCQGVPQARKAASVSNLCAPVKGCTLDFFWECVKAAFRQKLCFQGGTLHCLWGVVLLHSCTLLLLLHN